MSMDQGIAGNSATGAWTEAEIAAFSRERIERGSKSFAGAARLFSPDVRASAYMLYAWCRHCDDEIDGQEMGFNTAQAAGAATEERLQRLREKTIAAIEGRASEPIFLALQTVVTRHAIPARYPLDLIEGMGMDVRGARSATLQDTLLYSYHVAGCVGVMMAMIMGVRERPVLERACDLGIAFQLTNIARDVMADAGVGRVYLPGDWLVEAGVPRGAAGVLGHGEAVHSVTLRLLDEAERYYASAYDGLRDLPLRSALAIAAARRIYRGIGLAVRAGGPGGMEQRARVGQSRKLAAIGAAGVDTIGAKSWGRLMAPTPRDGLWTMPD